MAYVDENSFLGTAYTFIFLPIAAVSVRFAVRRWKRAMIGIDDWCSLAALFFTIAYCITVIVGSSQHVIGAHGNDESLQIKMSKITKATGTIRNPAIGLTKLSVLLFYVRVFLVHNKGFKRAVWTLVVFVGAWTIIFTLLDIFDCKLPISNLWLHPDRCVYEPGYNVTQAVLDVAMDVVLIILPLPMIWSLRMDARKKLLISLVFVVGMFSIVAAILRLVYVLAHAKMITSKTSTDILGVKTSDKIGSQSLIIFWNMVELGVGIVATCMPTFSPLFFESEAALWSLKSTLSGFVPLVGKDYTSEKSQATQRGGSDADRAESGVSRGPSTHSAV